MSLTEKPILFNTDMVRALLDGRKTVTRRVVKPRYRDDECSFQIVKRKFDGAFVRVEITDENEFPTREMQPPYQPGDVLYVRETFFEHKGKYYYKADGKHLALNAMIGGKEFFKWRPSIHMPKEAARIFLRVTGVRVERLQDITSADVSAEGTKGKFGSTRGAFEMLWDSTIKPAELALYGWIANPQVWVIEFERISREEALRNA